MVSLPKWHLSLGVQSCTFCMKAAPVVVKRAAERKEGISLFRVSTVRP